MIIKNKILAQYQNGNTSVKIYEDGTKIREYEGIPKTFFPESIDVKCTNWCDLGCKFCHENSTEEGNHADLEKLKSVLVSLPAGVELAVGGGHPLAHPHILDFLIWCKNKGLICNITINQLHLKRYLSFLKELIADDLIKGLGISINGYKYNEIIELKKLSNNIVYHIIAGIHDTKILDKLIELGNCKVLVLGYKTFGRGKDYFSKEVAENIMSWEKNIHKYFGKCILSFDNLALEQLNIKNKVSKRFWKNFYMGDDFTFTMYIDAVKQEYAPTSRSSDRKSFNEMSLFEYFINNRNED